MTQGTLPKPLTPILGCPSIKFALEHIAPLVQELVFIYASHLSAFNFEETVINLFKKTKCTFTCVPFATRGAVETALSGIIQLDLPGDLPIVFLDNDNVYPASLSKEFAPSVPFLGYDIDESESEAYSFLKRGTDGAVTSFAEKQRISNNIGTGVYGFSSVRQFLYWGKYTLQHGPFPKNEIYMSSLFVNMLAAGERVESVHVPIKQLGTAASAAEFLQSRPEKLRICFDLDNTLVTYPKIPGDYSTVSPVASNVSIARWAREQGHTIIVYTARRMTTHANNVGRVTADIGRVTFETLEKFDIPYDELIFGKPIADVYIDDRAVNPFFNSVRAMGLPFGSISDSTITSVPNALPNNKYNELRVVNGLVIKSGPQATMRGEAFFYEAVGSLTIAKYFPKFYGSSPILSALSTVSPRLQISIDLIKCVPLTTMMRAQLLDEYHITLVVGAFKEFHECLEVPITLPFQVLQSSYVDKLRSRFSDKAVYGDRSNVQAVLNEIETRIDEYTSGSSFSVARVIHGDAWFANILLTPTNELRFVDMRGLISGTPTLNGDSTADWAKLCQSVLGFDEIVFSLPRSPHSYRVKLLNHLANAMRAVGANVRASFDVCICLVAGSLHAYESEIVRSNLWEFVQRALFPTGDSEWEELVSILS